MAKILVTGGAGYIGSHTAVELQKQGFEVVIIDNLSNSKIETLDGIEKITGKRPGFAKFDLGDEKKLDKFFKKHPGIKAVIHFASLKTVGESVAKPLKYYRNNLLSLINLLEAMAKYKVADFVFSSSCVVYGQPDKLPVTENSPVKKATCPYGNIKKISEDIIGDVVLADKSFKAIVFRYFNAIGAHESALIGELPIGVPNNLIPFVTQTAIGKRKELKIFGDDYNTPDGTCVRDYIHVVDLAKAHIMAVRRLLEKKSKLNYKIFNLGAGRGYSVMEIVKTFEKVSGQKLNYKIVGRRAGDIEKIYADSSLANKVLGWKAERNLEEMLSSAWEWEKHLKSAPILK